MERERREMGVPQNDVTAPKLIGGSRVILILHKERERQRERERERERESTTVCLSHSATGTYRMQLQYCFPAMWELCKETVTKPICQSDPNKLYYEQERSPWCTIGFSSGLLFIYG